MIENDECSPVLLKATDASYGIITYPLGFKGALYQVNQNCYWAIQLPKGKIVNTFSIFILFFQSKLVKYITPEKFNKNLLGLLVSEHHRLGLGVQLGFSEDS